MKVIRAVPRMQAFVTRVCDTLLPQTGGVVKPLPARERMQRALVILDQFDDGGFGEDGTNNNDKTSSSKNTKKYGSHSNKSNSKSNSNNHSNKNVIRNDLIIENVVLTKPRSVMVDTNATSEKVNLGSIRN